jgi:hypothetical protein
MQSTEREAVISRAPPAEPRLLLQRDGAGPAPLDGGWWPRSADPAAELPGLILDLDKRHGRITRVLLGTTGWNTSRPSRLEVRGSAGSRVVRLGWFATMPVGLLTAISASDQRTDLVTIPPDTSERDAAAAMKQAAQAGNREHAPAILAAIAAVGRPTAGAAREDNGSVQLGAPQWEGGGLHDNETAPDRSRPVPGERTPLLPAAGPESS